MKDTFQPPDYDFDNLVAVRVRVKAKEDPAGIGEEAVDDLSGVALDYRQAVAVLDLRTGVFTTCRGREEVFGPDFGDQYYDELARHFGNIPLAQATFNAMRWSKEEAKQRYLKGLRNLEKEISHARERATGGKDPNTLRIGEVVRQLNDLDTELCNSGPIDLLKPHSDHCPCEWDCGRVILTTAGPVDCHTPATHLVFVAYVPLKDNDY